MAGNQRVLRARLADAEFSGNRIKNSGQNPVTELKAVTFYEGLGDLHAKALRLENLLRFLHCTFRCDARQAGRAGVLAKADLVTGMVSEFPELQVLSGAITPVTMEKQTPLPAPLPPITVRKAQQMTCRKRQRPRRWHWPIKLIRLLGFLALVQSQLDQRSVCVAPCSAWSYPHYPRC